MLWPDEVRKPDFDFLDEGVTVRPQELKMAESLIDSMAGDFRPEEFTDAYREALQQVIDVKIGKQETVVQPTTEEPIAPTVDLMAALRASVERARSRREGGEPATVTPITKATGKKAAAKKAAAQEAPAAKKAEPAAKKGAAKATPAKKTAKAGPAKKTAEKAAPAKAAKRAVPAAKSTAKKVTARAEPAKKAGAKKAGKKVA
jgi:DNA end-binding protein Ku